MLAGSLPWGTQILGHSIPVVAQRVRLRARFGWEVVKHAWDFVIHASHNVAAVTLMAALASFSISGVVGHLVHQHAYRPAPALLWAAFGLLLFMAFFEGAFNAWQAKGQDPSDDANPNLQALLVAHQTHPGGSPLSLEASYVETPKRKSLTFKWGSSPAPPELWATTPPPSPRRQPLALPPAGSPPPEAQA